MPYLKPHAWRRSRSHQRALASGAEATVLLGTAAASAAAAARARAGLCNGEARSRASMRAMDPSPLILRLDEASKNHWRRDRRPVIPMLLNARCGPTPFWHRRVCPLLLVFSQTLPSFREIPKHGETPILVTKPPGTRMQQAPYNQYGRELMPWLLDGSRPESSPRPWTNTRRGLSNAGKYLASVVQRGEQIGNFSGAGKT